MNTKNLIKLVVLIIIIIFITCMFIILIAYPIFKNILLSTETFKIKCTDDKSLI